MKLPMKNTSSPWSSSVDLHVKSAFSFSFCIKYKLILVLKNPLQILMMPEIGLRYLCECNEDLKHICRFEELQDLHSSFRYFRINLEHWRFSLGNGIKLQVSCPENDFLNN